MPPNEQSQGNDFVHDEFLKGLWIYQRLGRVLLFRKSPYSSATRNEADEHQDDGNHQQNMNQTAHRGAGYQAQEPQNYQDYTDRPQHMFSFNWLRPNVGLPTLPVIF
jgi:hypothetical protein